MTKVYVSGTFDLLHPGHIELFRTASRIADWVVVSVNTDEFTTEFKRKPIMNLEQRMACLRACRYVDEVIVNWDDWTGESFCKQMGFTEDWLRQYDIKLIYTPYTKGVSTTQIINSLKDEDEKTHTRALPNRKKRVRKHS